MGNSIQRISIAVVSFFIGFIVCIIALREWLIAKVTMAFLKDLFSIIQAALTCVGIVVGAIWTYFLFVRKRLSFPKLDIELFIQDKIILDGTRFIHAEIKLSNIGNVVLKSDYSELRLRNIVPIPDKIRPAIESGFDPISEGKTEFEWPLVVGREWKWNEKDFEIEPGESDSLHADYIIESNIKVSEFYFFLRNAKKKTQNIGWTLTRIHEFKSEGGLFDADLKKPKR